jgi:hypothetical protein
MAPEAVAGRIIITWPAPSGPCLHNWAVTLHDADTGEQIVTAFKVSIVMGADASWDSGAIEADITALIDEDGNILGAGQPVVITDEFREHCARADRDEGDEHFEGERYRTGVFRFGVAEMRVADPAT